MTNFQWHHRYYVTENRQQIKVTRFFQSPFPNQNFWLRQCTVFL